MYKTVLKDKIIEFQLNNWHDNYINFLEQVKTGDNATLDELNRILGEFSQDQARRDAEDLMSQLGSVFEDMFSDAERYQILPIEMRDFLEADPDSMFTFARKMQTAVFSKTQITEIIHLLEQNSEPPSLHEDCKNCVSRALMKEIRKIVQDD